MIRLPKLMLVLLTLGLMLGLAIPVMAEECKGKIKNLTADKQEVIVTDQDNKDSTFTLAATGKVFLNDKEVKLSELQSGDEVTITYEKKDEKMTASEIRAKRA